MGMSYDEYWNQDPNLVRAYRKAERLKEDMRNRDMWLQGMYIYEALCDASPLYHDFAKKGTKAHSYSEKPYDLHPAETARKQKRAAEKKTAAKGLRFMQAFMTAFNSKHNTGGETVAEH